MEKYDKPDLHRDRMILCWFISLCAWDEHFFQVLNMNKLRQEEIIYWEKQCLRAEILQKVTCCKVIDYYM